MNKTIKKYICNKDKLPSVTDDLLIASASYEQRCSAVADNLDDNYKCKHAIVFYNKEYLSRGKTRENLNKLKTQLKTYSKQVSTIETSLAAGNSIITAIHDYISKHTLHLDGLSISIDISTFPRHELLLLLRYIKMLNSKGPIRILYTRPKSYSEKWLSKGFKEIITVPSFAGTQIPGRKKLLIILAGHEEERMLKLWEEHEPSKTILVIGDPPTSDIFLTINKLKSKMILNNDYVLEAKAPANNPFSFCRKLDKIINDHKRDFNIFIAPMNTKIQTVGLFLLFEKYSWFQITLAVPNDYNVDNYSIGAEEIYEFSI